MLVAHIWATAPTPVASLGGLQGLHNCKAPYTGAPSMPGIAEKLEIPLGCRTESNGLMLRVKEPRHQPTSFLQPPPYRSTKLTHKMGFATCLSTNQGCSASSPLFADTR